jgi:hypothetical protein
MTQPTFKKATADRLKKVQCNYCLAKPGEPCSTASGMKYPDGEYHSARYNLDFLNRLESK